MEDKFIFDTLEIRVKMIKTKLIKTIHYYVLEYKARMYMTHVGYTVL